MFFDCNFVSAIPRAVNPALKSKGTDEPTKFRPPPPHLTGPHGLGAGRGYLDVLAGPVIHWHGAPNLTLKTTAPLPKPAPRPVIKPRFSRRAEPGLKKS